MKLRLDIFEEAPVFIRMFLTALLVLLDLSVTNAGSNHFVNREMALHAKALDEIYTISHPGMSFNITKDMLTPFVNIVGQYDLFLTLTNI